MEEENLKKPKECEKITQKADAEAPLRRIRKKKHNLPHRGQVVHFVYLDCAAARSRHTVSQLGSAVRRAAKSDRAAGMSIFCGQMALH